MGVVGVEVEIAEGDEVLTAKGMNRERRGSE